VSRPETRDAPVVRIGHPAGVIETESALELEGNGYRVTRATLGRTARRILEGRVFIAP
jgi:2-methylaconitate cis-trans-isomerase PrpF